MVQLQSIDLDLRDSLKDRAFRAEWFRAELEASVPKAFRELRELRGMTQGKLAKAIDTKQSAVSRFENSTEAVWELGFLLRMVEALDGRMSITVEPAENVINEYDDPQFQKDALSAASVAGDFKQQDRSSVFDQIRGSIGNAVGIGGRQSGYLSYKDESSHRSALPSHSYRLADIQI